MLTSATGQHNCICLLGSTQLKCAIACEAALPASAVMAGCGNMVNAPTSSHLKSSLHHAPKPCMLPVLLHDTVLLMYKQPGQSLPQPCVTRLQESPALGLGRLSRHKPPRQMMWGFRSSLRALAHQVTFLEMLPSTQVQRCTH